MRVDVVGQDGLDVLLGGEPDDLRRQRPQKVSVGHPVVADPVRHMVPGTDMYADPGAACRDFRGSTIVDGAGHWVHQEAPEAVNAALEEFLASLS